MRKKCIQRALLCATMTVGLLSAQGSAPTPPAPAQMAARLVARLTTLLNLTSDQQTQAATLFSAEETANASLFASFRTARSALQAAIEKNDADAIATQATQLGSLTTQQTENDAKTQASFYAILTADQQTKYQQLLAAGIAGPGPGFGGPGGPGGHGGPHGR